MQCGRGGIGIHKRLKISRAHAHAGSSPAVRTNLVEPINEPHLALKIDFPNPAYTQFHRAIYLSPEGFCVSSILNLRRRYLASRTNVSPSPLCDFPTFSITSFISDTLMSYLSFALMVQNLSKKNFNSVVCAPVPNRSGKKYLLILHDKYLHILHVKYLHTCKI